MSGLRRCFGLSLTNKRRRQGMPVAAIEFLETRAVPSAVTLQPDDIIMTRNFLPPGRDSAVSGFLIYRSSTQETIPITVPKLNDPSQPSYDVFIVDFQQTWKPNGDHYDPHLLFIGSVKTNLPTDDYVGGIFDLDLNTGGLSLIASAPNSVEMIVESDGTIVTTKQKLGDFYPAPLDAFSIQTLDGSQTWYQQNIYNNGSLAYRVYPPTTSLAFDDSQTLFAAFAEDDGFFVVYEGGSVTGHTPHAPGIYRMNTLDPTSRELVYSTDAGNIKFQFAADGSIIALITDVGDSRYRKTDFAQERVVKINPISGAATTLYVGSKKYDYADLQLTADGHIILAATDNTKDGNSTVLELTTTGKKRPKMIQQLVFQDQPDGNASYGVVTTGEVAEIVVVPPQPMSGAAAQANPPLSKVKPRHQDRAGHGSKMAR